MYVEITAQLARVMVNFKRKELMAPTRWPITQITRSIQPRCEGPRGRCSNPKGVCTVHWLYHGKMRILENRAAFGRQYVDARMYSTEQTTCTAYRCT